MATRSRKASKQSRARRARIPLGKYVRLRTVLDSLQIGALRYVLDAKTVKEREERFDELQAVLLPIVNQVWGRGEGQAAECPDGYINCNGVCVPYQCVEDAY